MMKLKSLIAEHWEFLIVLFIFLAFMGAIYWLVRDTLAYEDECRAAGGVPFQPYGRTRLCLDPSVVITIPKG